MANRPPSHSIADHAFGALARHEHAPGEEADHEHDADDNMVAEGSRELEEVPLISMGIDIGSSGTQIVFSRLLMRGPGEPLAMRRSVKTRQTLYSSPVALTPFEGDFIHGVKLRAIIDRAYVISGITPDDVETGVVIMTGAAARKENAAAIMDALAQEAKKAEKSKLSKAEDAKRRKELEAAKAAASRELQRYVIKERQVERGRDGGGARF